MRRVSQHTTFGLPDEPRSNALSAVKILHPSPLSEWHTNGDQRRWLVRPFLMRSSSMMLSGRTGVGKSTLALQLAASLAGEQKTWLDFPVAAVGSVLWLQLDMPRYEMAQLVDRAVTAKLLKLGAAIDFMRMYDIDEGEEWLADITKPLTDEEEVFDFNLLAGGDYRLLEQLVGDTRPIALFVDTVADAYYSMGNKGVNEEIRDVLRRLRNLMRPVSGAVIYLHHQRKRNMQAAVVSDDPDEFLGGMAWAGFASSSMQLVRTKKQGEDDDAPIEERYWLHLRKTRLGKLNFERFELEKTEHGLFKPKWSARQALELWPDYLSVAYGECGSGDIMAAVSRHLHISEGALRTAQSRMNAVTGTF